MAVKTIYKVIFSYQGSIYEIYAKKVQPSEFLGLIEIDQLLFGELTTLVIAPSEERLKTEFHGVKKTYVPLHSILRIDQVEKQGIPKIVDSTAKCDKVSVFPTPA